MTVKWHYILQDELIKDASQFELNLGFENLK